MPIVRPHLELPCCAAVWGLYCVRGIWGHAPRKIWDFTRSEVCSEGFSGSFCTRIQYIPICQLPTLFNDFRLKSTTYSYVNFLMWNLVICSIRIIKIKENGAYPSYCEVTWHNICHYKGFPKPRLPPLNFLPTSWSTYHSWYSMTADWLSNFSFIPCFIRWGYAGFKFESFLYI